MVTQELLDAIIAKYKHNQRRDEIREDLMADGYKKSDIDEGIAQIQHHALLQIPFVAKAHKLLQRLDAKTAHLSVKATIGVFVVIAAVILVIAFILYVSLDPLSVQAGARDRERQQAFAAIHTALLKYYNRTHAYPPTLNRLAPSYLHVLPLDPKTQQSYEYKILDAQGNYQLCVNYETKPVDCVSSSVSSVIPTVIIVATPMPR